MKRLFLSAVILCGIAEFASPARAFDVNDFLNKNLGPAAREIDRIIKAVPRPAPEPSRPNPPPPAKSPQAEPTPAPVAMPSRPTSDPGEARNDRALVTQVQRLLNIRGYNAGTVDGLFGAGTANAIKAYQRDAGLAVTGEPSQALLEDLRRGRTVARAAKPAPAPAKSIPAAASGGQSTGPTHDGEKFVSQFFAPEGIYMGMPVAEAKAKLAAAGYTQSPSFGCRFERKGADGKGRDELSFVINPGDPAERAAARKPGTGNVGERFERQSKCAEEGMIVVGLSYKDEILGTRRKVDALAELDELVRRAGKYDTCRQVQRHGVNLCVWRSPSQDVKIKTATVTISPSWGRKVDIEADLLEILAAIPERAKDEPAIRQQALAICENSNAADFKRVDDCGCIADYAAKAYVRGEMDRIAPETISNKFTGSCPGKPEQLQAYFEERCLVSFGTTVDAKKKAWALGGGCSCVGKEGAERYRAEPTSTKGIIGKSASVCGINEAELPAKSEAAPSDSSRITPAGSSYAPVMSVPQGIRPLEMWRIEGRPVIHEQYRPMNAVDRTFDYRPQEQAFERAVNLMLLENEPDQLKQETAQLLLAAENLADGERDRLMPRCDPSQPFHCQWGGKDEFERRAAQQEFASRYAPGLTTLGQQLPREFIYVESARLLDYDAARGGFPIRLTNDPFPTFILAKGSLFGYGTTIRAVRPREIEAPLFWPMDQAAAQELLSKVPQRFVAYAWTYKITGIEVPQDKYAGHIRAVRVEPVGLRLYADARLTEPVGELALNGEKVAASPAPQSGKSAGPSAQPAAAASIVLKPLTIQRLNGRPLFDLSRPMTKEDNQRYLNLLVVGQRPELAKEPGSAFMLARENVVGLTPPSRSASEWAGSNEFEKQRSKVAFEQKGADEVVSFAPKLPQEILVRYSTVLGKYDFDRQLFPILDTTPKHERDSVPPGHIYLQYNAMANVARQPILLKPTNGLLPDTWNVPVGQAPSAVAGLPVSQGDQRRVVIGYVAKLKSLGTNDRGWIILDAEIADAAIYADDNLTRKIAALPLN